MFPYNTFNHFDLGWIGIVEEFEWSYKHLQRESMSPQSYKPLMAGPDAVSPTSVSKSKFYLQDDKSTFSRGDFIHIIIETSDEYGNRRLRGGDFITGTMFNARMQTSTAGRTVDYGNGTYSMYFYAGWKGQASITVSLSFTREAILFYDLMKYRDGRVVWLGTFMKGNVIEWSNCTLISEGIWKNSCSFINTWALGETIFLCNKPASLPCSALTNITHRVGQMFDRAEQEVQDRKYLFEGKFRKAMFSASPIKVNIQDSNKQVDVPTCGPDLPMPLSSGYWKSYHTFVPLVCRSQEWTPEQRFKCASDKLFFFIGDSTIMQFTKEVFGKLDIIGGRVNFQKHFLALRMGGGARSVTNIMFGSDFIDRINSSVCVSQITVVAFNFSFHYGLWSVRAYLSIVNQFKLSLLRLFERCPDTIAILKLAHPRDNTDVPQNVHSGNYLYYDMNRMLRRVLGGIGVHFLDVWDMVLAHPDDNEVHVKSHIIIQQADMMLSYVCPRMVKSNS
ncbi:NXPE family member 3-like [Ptychodera flava]|uniref:NXPE family member 3-like n=1 Tax=Ptychodera flava TaxID=63121 RepID=UPI00396AA19C